MDNPIEDLVPIKKYNLEVEKDESPKVLSKRLILNALLVASEAIHRGKNIQEAVQAGLIEEVDETVICVRILLVDKPNEEDLPYRLGQGLNRRYSKLRLEDFEEVSEQFWGIRSWLDGEDSEG